MREFTLKDLAPVVVGVVRSPDLRAGEVVALMMPNRSEHVHAGAVPTTVYATLAPDQVAYPAANCGRLLPAEWTAESEELTPTLKLKRRVVHGKYTDVLDAPY